MSEDTRPTLLIVDDDEPFRSVLGAALERRGYAVTLAPDGIAALSFAGKTAFEYALVDVRMPTMNGIELVGRLREIDDGTRIVVLTGYGTIANAVEAIKRGAIDYLTKPVDADTCEKVLLGERSTTGDTIPSLERVEWEYIQRVLADADGNISDAARRLRVHRRTLQRKLSKHAPRR